LKTFLAILFVFTHLQSFSQDLIILKTGEEIKAKVLEYDEYFIRYRLFDDLTAKIQSESKKNVLLIKYNNGTTIVFDNKNTDIQNDTSTITSIIYDLEEIAKKDAQTNYNPTLPVVLAGCTSCCIPGIGIFTALVPPNMKNYNMPVEFAYNSDYVNFYGEEVKKIKQKKVLIMTTISTATSLLMWLYILNII
jgi:hypothetical protein